MCWVAPVLVRNLNTAVVFWASGVPGSDVWASVLGRRSSPAPHLFCPAAGNTLDIWGSPSAAFPSFVSTSSAGWEIHHLEMSGVLWLAFKLLIMAPWKHLALLFNSIIFLSGVVKAGRITQLVERVVLSTEFSFPPLQKKVIFSCRPEFSVSSNILSLADLVPLQYYLVQPPVTESSAIVAAFLFFL